MNLSDSGVLTLTFKELSERCSELTWGRIQFDTYELFSDGSMGGVGNNGIRTCLRFWDEKVVEIFAESGFIQCPACDGKGKIKVKRRNITEASRR